MQILWTFPDVPSDHTMFMLEALTFKIALVMSESNDISSVNLQVEAWTNVYHKDNPEGVWHAIPLDLIDTEKHQDKGKIIGVYGKSLVLTGDGIYAFTFRAKKRYDNYWLWAGNFKEDGVIEVKQPFDDVWSKGPSFDNIQQNVYLGNFMTASRADEFGFDAVLNVAEELDLVEKSFTKPVLYKKIPMKDGAQNQIPDEQLYEAVEWLREQNKKFSKVLVNCRAGIGRAGSTAVAFVFAENPDLSYSEAYDVVYTKRFVYPHKGLKDTICRLFPRKTKEV